jgi:hypothetical protein
MMNHFFWSSQFVQPEKYFIFVSIIPLQMVQQYWRNFSEEHEDPQQQRSLANW